MPRVLVLMALTAAAEFGCCSNHYEMRERKHGPGGRSDRERSVEGPANGEGVRETSSNFLTLDETNDTVLKGTRLIVNHHVSQFIQDIQNGTEIHSALLLYQTRSRQR